MKLVGNTSILFGGEIVTDQVLETYRQQWKGFVISPGIGANNCTDETAFHALLFETTPIAISRDMGYEQLIFQASFKRFPYSINGNRNFASFGLRLVPKQGRVKSVEFDRGRLVAINTLLFIGDYLCVDLGNGSLHLEIFFRPAEPQTEIGPPAGFQKEIILKER